MAYSSAAKKAKENYSQDNVSKSRNSSIISTARSRAGMVYVSSKKGNNINIKPISRFK